MIIIIRYYALFLINIFSMFNELFDLSTNTAIPDLISEGPLPDDLLQLGDLLPMPEHSDIIAISRRLEDLTIENNTQALQIKLERMKRRRLRPSLRVLEQNLLRPCPEVASLRQELIATQENQNMINYQFEWDMTAMKLMSFRCLTRMYQFVSRLLPHQLLTPENNCEMTQMLHEISQTFHLLFHFIRISSSGIQ